MLEIIQGALDEITTNYTNKTDIDDSNKWKEEMEDSSLQYLWLVIWTIEYFIM